MLPDLASMAGVRLDTTELPDDVAAGVRHHYAADAAFHGHESFIRLLRTVRTALADAGVARGPARAAAHVGVELALDGWLLAEVAHAHDALSDALAARTAVPLDGA